MKVDPSIVITLRTKWYVMQPTKSFCEGYLLPLAGILDHNGFIRRMNLSGTGVTNVKPMAGNGDSNARVLHQVLMTNTAIETLVRKSSFLHCYFTRLWIRIGQGGPPPFSFQEILA